MDVICTWPPKTREEGVINSKIYSGIQYVSVEKYTDTLTVITHFSAVEHSYRLALFVKVHQG